MDRSPDFRADFDVRLAATVFYRMGDLALCVDNDCAESCLACAF
ncbi:hypothetical protein ACI8B_280164 [Acinetobacter proteolyticus]|uniref:Uncharacterized protein n=1 Tax=Acinetobacter proteolyticus TaxID=1776741 RepID=A0A653K5S2_9GAMM|nr:hypothetical protein ACI8B_280164 [Acinetobacter proteolyticus]